MASNNLAKILFISQDFFVTCAELILSRAASQHLISVYILLAGFFYRFLIEGFVRYFRCLGSV